MVLSLQGRSHRFKSCSAHKGFSEINFFKILKTPQKPHIFFCFDIISFMSNAEELAKYKKLLDDRVISQEDFDKKKEELLNRTESSGLTTDNTWLVALLLCLFVGFLGIHRFYVGKSGTGFLQIITIGGFGIWVLIDLIMIVTGKFTNKEGNFITR